MILYTEADALDSHRVRLVLAEKGLQVDIQLVDPDNLPEDLIHVNPHLSLPTLVDRDLVLYDARVIVDYVDERYPHPPMMPIDPVSRSKSRLALYRMEKDWYSLIPGLTGDRNAAANARKILRESLLASQELFRLKPFFLSDDYSLLDASLTPFLWRLQSWGVVLSAQATAVQEYTGRQFARPGFQLSLTEPEKLLC